jgi:erythromycin esterase-like protein
MAAATPGLASAGLAAAIAAAAEPLPDPGEAGFGDLIDRFADRRVVLLGEASHGTAEFYRARAAITRRLVERHGFAIVAVEADWPDAAAIDRHVRLRPPGREPPDPAFSRFPTWMWRNTEVAAFVAWLRQHNEGRPPAQRTGFHGLDLYNLQGSIAAVVDYLDRTDPEAAAEARRRYGCLAPWQREPAGYGRAVLSERYRSCAPAVLEQCRALLRRRLAADDGDELLDAAQNARLVAAAERYYRTMYHGGPDAWNLRDRHMFETLCQLLEARGPGARAVVWAHNSHIGDARHTEMGVERGELNLGQLCRDRFGEAVALIGLGTHEGNVAAADDWGGDMRVMQVRPSQPGSYERLCHESGRPRFLLDPRRDPALAAALTEPRLERFIGVIYRPDSELASHYMAASLSRQFDAWLWFDQTRAVVPLGPEHARPGPAETWPFGL